MVAKKPSVIIQTLRWVVRKGLKLPSANHFGRLGKTFWNHPSTETDTETDADHKRFFIRSFTLLRNEILENHFWKKRNVKNVNQKLPNYCVTQLYSSWKQAFVVAAAPSSFGSKSFCIHRLIESDWFPLLFMALSSHCNAVTNCLVHLLYFQVWQE